LANKDYYYPNNNNNNRSFNMVKTHAQPYTHIIHTKEAYKASGV